jgi:hypothetical protein
MKRKLYSCNVNIYFNHEFIPHKITPNFAKSRNPETPKATSYACRKAKLLRIKDEIELLCVKTLKFVVIPSSSFIFHTPTHGVRAGNLLKIHIKEKINIEFYPGCTTVFEYLQFFPTCICSYYVACILYDR